MVRFGWETLEFNGWICVGCVWERLRLRFETSMLSERWCVCKIFDIDSGRFEIWSFLSFLSFLSEFQNHHVLVLSRREEREQSRTRDTHKEMRIKQNTETRTSDFWCWNALVFEWFFRVIFSPTFEKHYVPAALDSNIARWYLYTSTRN